MGPLDVFDLRNFAPYSADELDVNHFVVELPNIAVLDDNKEDCFNIECLDIPFLLSNLMTFALTVHILLTNLSLTILMLTVPILYMF